MDYYLGDMAKDMPAAEGRSTRGLDRRRRHDRRPDAGADGDFRRLERRGGALRAGRPGGHRAPPSRRPTTSITSSCSRIRASWSSTASSRMRCSPRSASSRCGGRRRRARSARPISTSRTRPSRCIVGRARGSRCVEHSRAASTRTGRPCHDVTVVVTKRTLPLRAGRGRAARGIRHRAQRPLHPRRRLLLPRGAASPSTR